ncbi:transporter substrate-binding domain-containing protein [Vibrio sp. YMD68]|uniref:substrate-binding periplasmic protein n=1 Tax=Vibrio sp. YMD68 TaxID=3042300 RepID=UPI00249B988E|nr:transporter substrate-binding domain-containing protein [Vibrio sp. YMD68]WGV98735.1 transporter substrate-binding domain-containing protein [Vibrio sp. YMD68]
MMNNPFRFLSTSLLSLLLTSTVQAHSQNDNVGRALYLTEEYPPANFILDGQLTGYSVDLLRAAAKAVGEDIGSNHIVLQSWSDAYRTALTTPNTAVFSMTRTEHREDLFLWVGPISKVRVVVMAKRDSNINVDKSLDMAKYRIGVVEDDIGEQLLLDLGIPRAAMVEVKDVGILAEMLTKNRVDLIAYSEKTALWMASQSGIKSNTFQRVYTLKEGYTYYAFNKDSDPALIEKLQQGIDIIKANTDENGVNQYQEILKKYQ